MTNVEEEVQLDRAVQDGGGRPDAGPAAASSSSDLL